MSRPHLVKHLEAGDISSTKASTYRRDVNRRKALTELTHMGEDLGLNDE